MMIDMLILTSSVASVAAHMYQNYLLSHGYMSVLFIDTAAEPEVGNVLGDDDWLQADLQSLRDQGYRVDRYTVTGKSLTEVSDVFNKYDILYMCGGDTKYLVEQLQASGAFTLLQQLVADGKPYIGTSAGSIVAGPRLPDYFYDKTDTDILCLGLVDFTLVPHWGSSHFESQYKNGKRLDQVFTINQNPLLLLTDSQYVVVDEEGKMILEQSD